VLRLRSNQKTSYQQNRGLRGAWTTPAFPLASFDLGRLLKRSNFTCCCRVHRVHCHSLERTGTRECRSHRNNNEASRQPASLASCTPYRVGNSKKVSGCHHYSTQQYSRSCRVQYEKHNFHLEKRYVLEIHIGLIIGISLQIYRLIRLQFDRSSKPRHHSFLESRFSAYPFRWRAWSCRGWTRQCLRGWHHPLSGQACRKQIEWWTCQSRARYH
jgi:hypothetical protein